MAPMSAQTILEGRHFEANGCNLKYTAAYNNKEGVNLILLAHKRDVTYGYFDGICEVEGKEVKIERAWGFFELVFTRL